VRRRKLGVVWRAPQGQFCRRTVACEVGDAVVFWFVLEITNISKVLGGIPVVSDLTVRVGAGETLSVIGPSGCGKSTLLRLILFLTKPDRGVIKFDDMVVTNSVVGDVRRRVGYVIQDGGLFPHLTARGNVTIQARHAGWSRERLSLRLEYLCELTKIPADILDRYPAELSGGQRQRVALMRGLMMEPDVLLLDEPLGALDPMIRYELQDELRDIFRSLNKTVVIVTHDLNEAAFFGDRVMLMKAGRAVQVGPVSEMVQQPADQFVTDFFKAQRFSVSDGAE